MYSRREFGKLALAALAVPPATRALAQEAGSVRLGVQTYSFRDLTKGASDPIAAIVDAMKGAGFTECELWAGGLEPKDAKNWRLQTPLDHFAGMKKKFADAGMRVYAYNYSFRREMSDEEIDRGFQMARALGAEIITASTTLDTAKRVVPFAEKHKMVVAMHNHSNLEDPNEFATPESFAKAMQMSKQFKVTSTSATSPPRTSTRWRTSSSTTRPSPTCT